MDGRYVAVGVRVLQLAIFGLGGLAALAADNGDWVFTAIYTALAYVAYRVLHLDIAIEYEEDEEEQ